MAFVRAWATGSWPTRSANCCGRYRRATTVYSRPGSGGAVAAGGDCFLAIRKANSHKQAQKGTKINQQIKINQFNSETDQGWFLFSFLCLFVPLRGHSAFILRAHGRGRLADD